MQSNLIECVVIDPEKDDDLPEEGNAEPDVPDGVWGTYAGDLLEWFGIGEEVEVYGSKDAQHQRLPL